MSIRFQRKTIATQTDCQRLRLRPVLFAVAVAALAGGALLAPGRAEAGKTSTVNCKGNPDALTNALAVANDGDTLAIRGTCRGTFEIAHSLKLEGLGAAVLNGQAAGTVLVVDSGKTVTVENLLVTGGSSTGGFGETVAGGISNSGTLTLRNTKVNGNSAGAFESAVGGILNTGSLTLKNSTVGGNTAGAERAVGGIINHGVLSLQDGAVNGNVGHTGMGGVAWGGVLNDGTLRLDNSRVSGNSATGDGFGAIGGIDNSGTLTLRTSRVDRNSASEPGGGGYALGGISSFGTLTLRDSSVSENSARGSAFDGQAVGGIDAGGTVTLANSRVSQNQASAGDVAIGGISNIGMLALRNSSVRGNSASAAVSSSVGGIGNFFSGTVELRNSRVANNIPNNCNFSDPACA